MYGQVDSLYFDKITISQFFTYEIVLLITICILQLIKEAVSTRNTHSRSKTNKNNLLK
ncbi:hypothetical protein bsdcttw_46780 [Anaerocolumna chitinilytica]|uniref:Uncharacterized protein n=1 Tax=Anaerocolumna chitinilytica TaxID=1727145 RepID=A0A7M3SAM0_9FIRM|nr:hypothetical protein bsdcttw_46780 [Anaerocolumna chitinilytica]